MQRLNIQRQRHQSNVNTGPNDPAHTRMPTSGLNLLEKSRHKRKKSLDYRASAHCTEKS